jgi:electron transfer flavoprotein alpha subunit
MSVFWFWKRAAGRSKRVSSWEALAAAHAAWPAQDVTAVVIGAQTETLAAEAAAKGVGKVVRVEHPLLAQYTADGYSLALHQLLQSQRRHEVRGVSAYVSGARLRAGACAAGLARC